MNVPLLIDAIVRQTMALIAQLSTTAGHRSPLSHVADRVFLDLVGELERQRVGKKAIADMFGLALRSYQPEGGATLTIRDRHRRHAVAGGPCVHPRAGER